MWDGEGQGKYKRRATETQGPAQVILGIEIGGISEVAAINLPALHHIRRNIRLQRQANQQLPIQANREYVPKLSIQYQRSYANEQFLIFDSGQGMLIEFSSLEQTKVSNYFHSHKNVLVIELLRFVPRYFFRYSLLTHKLTDAFSPVFTLCSQTKLKKLIPLYQIIQRNWTTRGELSYRYFNGLWTRCIKFCLPGVS